MGRIKVWTGSLISNNEKAKRRTRIISLLPYQQPWRCQVHQNRVEIYPCGGLWNGTLQFRHRDHHSKSQLVPPALQHRLCTRDHTIHNPGEPTTRDRDQEMPTILQLRHLERVATNSWIKSLWKKIDKLGIKLEVIYRGIPLPREKDLYIMEEFMAVEF